MNTARLARKWAEAEDDYAQMVEALGEEIDDLAAGLVTRDYLHKCADPLKLFGNEREDHDLHTEQTDHLPGEPRLEFGESLPPESMNTASARFSRFRSPRD